MFDYNFSMYAQPETLNLKLETRNLTLFPSQIQGVKKKVKKEMQKDLERRKRVLLLHPQ